jgi:hypothetical protein
MGKDKGPIPFHKKPIFLIFTLFSAIGALLGAAGAYMYYLKVGCATGNCAITSSPWVSTLWGAVMGYLIGDIISPRNENGKSE